MKKPIIKGIYIYLIYTSLCIVIVLLGKTSFNRVFDKGFSYVFSPVFNGAVSGSQVVIDWGDALTGAGSYIQEYKMMKEEIALLKIENAERILDYEEYRALKEQEAFLQKDGRYLQSKIMKFDTQGDIIIDVGEENEVKEGDIVTLGKAFIGRVFEVGSKTSLVKLPSNKASSFEVVVVDSKIDLNEEREIDALVKSKGVARGDVDNILIENLSINASVEDGDLVLIRDERVGEILILGTLIGISKNPASTYKEGFVSPIVDYSKLLTVFVKVK